jgi:SAM-dependent methyltransferase
MTDYRKSLEQQKSNSTTNPNLTYLSWLYQKVHINLNLDANVLEIGAGAGISEDFLPDVSILKTDILSWESNSVLGNIDAEKLPFLDGEFSNVIAVDVLHHTNSPVNVINESLRVLKNGGKIIIVEPYVSIFSYSVYKLFHNEDTHWYVDLENLSQKKSEVFQGDQGISRQLFKNKKKIDDLKKSCKTAVKIEKELVSVLSFFATGGLSKPLPTPKFVMRILLRIENRLPQLVLKFCASRIIVVITKNEELST